MNIKFCEIKQDATKPLYKIESEKDDPKSIWKLFKEQGASSKRCSNNEILGLKVNGETVSDESVLAENFNKYFINVASKLKESTEQTDFSKLKSFIDSSNSRKCNFWLICY